MLRHNPEFDPCWHKDSKRSEIALKKMRSDGRPDAAVLNKTGLDFIDSELPLNAAMSNESLFRQHLNQPGASSSLLGAHQQVVSTMKALLTSVNDHYGWLKIELANAVVAAKRLKPPRSRWRFDPWYREGGNSQLAFRAISLEIAVPVASSLSLTALAAIGSAVEFTFFQSQIIAGSLFETPGESKMALPIEPGTGTCIAATFVPVICVLAGLKNISRQDRHYNENRAQRFISIGLILGSFVGLWLFCYFVVGEQESGNATGLPWYVVAVTSSTMAFANTVFLSGALQIAGRLFVEEPSNSPIHNAATVKISQLNTCVADTNKTIGDLEGFLKRCRTAEETFFKELDHHLKLKQEQERNADALRVASETLDEVKSVIQSLKNSSLSILLAFAIFIVAGCHTATSPSPNAGSPGVSETLPEEEYFVFDDGHLSPKKASELIKRLATTNLPGGARLTVFHGPNRLLVGGLDVPFGRPKQRESNPYFSGEWAVIEQFYENSSPESDTVASVFGIARAISDTKRNENSLCHAICLGSLVYHDPSRESFSMREGIVPSPAWIGDESTPLGSSIPLPPATRVQCFIPESNFGDNPQHNELIRQVTSSYIASIGGHLTRISPDLSLAGTEARSILPPATVALGGTKNMINTRRKEHRTPDQERESRPIPVEQADLGKVLQMMKPDSGSLVFKIAREGGNPWGMSDLDLQIAVVVDRSTSMSSSLTQNGALLKQIGQEMTPLVRSLKIAFLVRSSGSDSDFPLTTIEVGKPSQHRMNNFLDRLGVSGSDENFEVMLRDGVAAFDTKSHADRRILLIVSDHIHGDPATLADTMASWVSQQPECHRSIAMYTSAEARPQFETVCGGTAGARAAPSGDALIEEVISLTKQR